VTAKILLAEDDANLRETLAEVLRAEGYEVNTVPNGQAALEALGVGSGEDAANLIIVDGLLPKVSGQDVCKFVRGRGLDTPIVFMSGVFKSQDQQKDAKEKYGVKAYLTKPFDAAKLVETVKPLLAATGAAAVQAEPLPAEGTLVENPVLYLLWRAQKEYQTGVLELFAERDRARVFVFKGKAVLAQHSDPQINVGIELIREGVIDAETYKQACEMAMQRGVGLYDVFKGEGWCTEAQAKSAYKAIIPRVLERIVAFSGRFRFVATEAFGNIVPGSPVPIIDSLLVGLRKASEKELEPHVTPRRPLRLAPGDAWGEVARRLTEACGSDSLQRAINGRATIAQMLEASSSPQERASRYRQVYLLMSTMAVRASEEVIPMSAPVATAAQSVGGSTTTGAQKPVQLDPSPPAAQGAPRPTEAPQPRTMNAGSSSAGSKGPVRPAVDENADKGVLFNPEETEARNKIAAKFDELEGKDYFAMLGVKKGAGPADVKKAYFGLAKDFHTDAFAGLKLGAAQKKLDHVFQSIQTAYTTLSDDKKRAEYQAKLDFEEQGQSTDIAALMNADGEMHKARLLVERGDFGNALKIVERILAVKPKDDEYLGYQRFLSWWMNGKSQSGASVVIKQLEEHFKNQQGALALKEFVGRIATEVGDYRTAKIAFKKVLELDPKHAGAQAASRNLQRKIEEDEKNKGGALGKLFKR
jgi:DNA-binding response OmpR family regulator/DnaJ-domain-containing protein 1